MWIGIMLMHIWIRIQIRIGTHGNSDPDPVRHQNNADPQHWLRSELNIVHSGK
jgi:hypothetical protein